MRKASLNADYVRTEISRWQARSMVMSTRGIVAAENPLAATTFEITRLLPEQASSFHYRVKNALTGQERVAAEGDIRAAVP